MPFFNGTDPNDSGPLSPLQNLRLRLAAQRAKQKGERFDGSPLGGDLRGPHRSEGYPQLVAGAMKYAWSWQGNALPAE